MSEITAAAERAASELRQTDAAFALMRSNALEMIATSEPAESFLRENLYRTVQIIELVKTHLQAVVDSGKVEQFAQAVREQSKPREAS